MSETEESRTHAGEAVTPEPEESPFKAFTFGAVMTRSEQTITFPGMDPKWFVRAKAPDARGERLIASASLVGTQRDDQPDEAQLRAGTYEVYLAKCEQQITRFVLPSLNEAGEIIGELSFDGENNGRNAKNRAVYDALTEQAARYLEGALDKIAGRDTGRAKEYEALKNA